jgi:hypothetical protein
MRREEIMERRRQERLHSGGAGGGAGGGGGAGASVSDGGGAVVVTTMFPLHDLDIRRWWFLFVSNMTKICKTMWHVVGLNVVCQILEVN